MGSNQNDKFPVRTHKLGLLNHLKKKNLWKIEMGWIVGILNRSKDLSE